MEKPAMDRLALGSYRVLDLTDESGAFCTKILAALGADVIRIEPPGGDPTRRIGPFYHDEADPEKSLHWFTYNLSKRSITLNLESAAGQALFMRLAETADFVVECFRPGYLEGLGLGYARLSAANPRIIVTSITPFGSTGPRARLKGSNLVCSAMSGYLLACGDPDRSPVQIATPAAYIQAGLQAAAATLVADRYRQETGMGQHVDLSIQEALMDQILPFALLWNSRRAIPSRSTFGAVVPDRPGGTGPGVFACKDGYVVCFTTIDRGRQPLREWLASAGMAGDLLDERWNAVFVDGAPVTPEQKQHIDKLFEAFAAGRTSGELMEEAQRKGIQVVKVNSVQEVVENPHSRETGYFTRVEHPELNDTITYAGSPFKSEEMCWQYWRRAPFVGEHSREVYEGELGLTPEEIDRLGAEGAV